MESCAGWLDCRKLRGLGVWRGTWVASVRERQLGVFGPGEAKVRCLLSLANVGCLQSILQMLGVLARSRSVAKATPPHHSPAKAAWLGSVRWPAKAGCLGSVPWLGPDHGATKGGCLASGWGVLAWSAKVGCLGSVLARLQPGESWVS